MPGTIMNSEHWPTRLIAELSGMPIAGGGQLLLNSGRNWAVSPASICRRQLSAAACSSSKGLPVAAPLVGVRVRVRARVRVRVRVSY